MPAHRAQVSFRGKVCWVLSVEKLDQDSKTFKEIEGLLRMAEFSARPQQQRALILADWIGSRAKEYEGPAGQ